VLVIADGIPDIWTIRWHNLGRERMGNIVSRTTGSAQRADVEIDLAADSVARSGVDDLIRGASERRLEAANRLRRAADALVTELVLEARSNGATWAEIGPTGREYCHTFFEFADGGALAFFQWADQDENPIELRSPGHIAFECDAQTQNAIKARLEAGGYDIRLTDHGYCLSLYVHDPNNLRLEFTVDHRDLAKIMARHQSDPHADLKRWLAGDHTPNNDMRGH